MTNSRSHKYRIALHLERKYLRLGCDFLSGQAVRLRVSFDIGIISLRQTDVVLCLSLLRGYETPYRPATPYTSPDRSRLLVV